MFGSVKLFGLIGVGLAAGALTLPNIGQYGGAQPCDYIAPQQGLDPRTDPVAARNYARDDVHYAPAQHPFGQKRQLTRKVGTQFQLVGAAGVAPAECAYDYKEGHLRQGRIIARIDSDVAYKDTANPKFGTGVSYVWVDYDGPNKWRAVIIPHNNPTAKTITESQVVFKHYPGAARNFSEARWLFDPADDHLWASCAQNGCCTLNWS